MTEEQHALVQSYLDKYGTPIKVIKTAYKNMYITALGLGHEEEDIEQQGNLAIIAAAKSFDASRGSFCTHANWQLKSWVSKLIGYSTTKGRTTTGHRVGMDAIPAQDEPIDVRLERADVKEALSKLVRRDRDILRMRFGFTTLGPLTRPETAARIGVSTGRIHQLETRALNKLKEMLA